MLIINGSDRGCRDLQQAHDVVSLILIAGKSAASLLCALIASSFSARNATAKLDPEDSGEGARATKKFPSESGPP